MGCQLLITSPPKIKEACSTSSLSSIICIYTGGKKKILEGLDTVSIKEEKYACIVS